MKTAKEWFNCLRPDLRSRAIKATRKDILKHKHKYFSEALNFSFCWDKESSYEFWDNIWQEAIDIEEGRKPDIKPKLKGHDKLEELFTKYTSKNWKEFTSYLRENGIRLMYVIHNESDLIEANKELKTWREAGYP